MKALDQFRAHAAAPRWLAVALVVVLGAIIPLLSLRLVWTLDDNQLVAATKELPESDFANTWAGGRLALDGRVTDIFDVERYRNWFAERFGPASTAREWSYPPTMLLVGVPLALLPLLTACLFWNFGSIGALWLALRRIPVSRPTVLVTLLSPGVLMSLFFSQTGTASAALFIGGLLLVETRPIFAGVLIGLLTIKPQMGLLIPICLIAGGHGRAFVSASITALIIIAATGLLFGWSVFELYYNHTHPMMVAFMEQPSPERIQMNMISLFLTLRALGASVTTAYAFQITAALGAALTTWFVWRQPIADPFDRAMRVGLTGCLGLLASPYIHNYDMVVYSFTVALLFERNGWRISSLVLLWWMWPDFVRPTNTSILPVTPVIVCLLIIYVIRALRRADGRGLISAGIPAGPKTEGAAPERRI